MRGGRDDARARMTAQCTSRASDCRGRRAAITCAALAGNPPAAKFCCLAERFPVRACARHERLGAKERRYNARAMHTIWPEHVLLVARCPFQGAGLGLGRRRRGTRDEDPRLLPQVRRHSSGAQSRTAGPAARISRTRTSAKRSASSEPTRKRCRSSNSTSTPSSPDTFHSHPAGVSRMPQP
jgi:hypothetical protein